MGRFILGGTSIAAALLLAVGSVTAAQASTARHHRAERRHRHVAPSQCEIWAKTHAFEVLSTAKHAAGGAAILTGRRAKVVCGGPDDWHFVYGTATVTDFVRADARNEVLATTGAGIGFKAIRTSRLVRYLPRDAWTRTFQLTGPPDATTALEEVYHP
jgi:hypothetical protein